MPGQNRIRSTPARSRRATRLRLSAWIILLVALFSLLWAQSARPAAADISYVSQATAVTAGNVTSLVINVPANTTQGDLLLAALAIDQNPTVNTPAGWTLLNSAANGTVVTLAVFYRFASNAEPANYTFTWSNNQQAAGAIVRYTGITTAPTFGGANGTSANPTSPSVASAPANAKVVRLYAADQVSISPTPYPPPPHQGRWNAVSGGGAADGVTFGVADRVQPTAGATGTAAFTLAASQAWRAATVVLSPAAMDYGDAPNSYGTTLAANGPRHANVNALRIGTNATDTEANGVPGAAANGDDTAGTDDEDGVASFPALNDGMTGAYNVTVVTNNATGRAATLVGWIDFDCDGVFKADESATASVANGAPNAVLGFTIPADIQACTSYARFRITTDAITGDSPNGPASNGDVEDYQVTIAAVSGGAIKGYVFRDYNANGTRDAREPGTPNVTVTAYNPAGAAVASTTTDANGNYILRGLTDGTPYRLEFTNLPAYLQPGPRGTNSGTTVIFSAPPASSVGVGTANAAEYCQANPDLCTNVYMTGARSENPNLDTLISHPSTGPTSGANTGRATVAQIGATWGLAYQRSTNSMFAAAFVKRLSDLGPGTGRSTSDGTGTIYRVILGGARTPFVDLDDLFGATTTGNNPHTNWVTDNGDADFDLGAYGAVGKVGLGDLDISEDETTLYVINLVNRSLYKLPIGLGPTAPSADSVLVRAVPDPGCANGQARPFALKFHDGKVYVGGVCTAENGGTRANLEAYVYTYDPATDAWSASPVLRFPLNYPRGCADVWTGYNEVCSNGTAGAPAEWEAWTDAYPVPGWSFDTGFVMHPQPMLTDIEFDDQVMILGFRDRFGDQIGYQDVGPTEARPTTDLLVSIGAGDTLRASPNTSGGWTLERNAQSNPVGAFGPTAGDDNGQGPGAGLDYLNGFGEFYYQDAETGGAHDEDAIGGLALLPSVQDVATTFMDPLATFTGGTAQFDNTDGTSTRRYQVYANADPYFRKSNGLGDLEALCSAAPIEIGNRVWRDTDGDGIQDPGEPPIANVTLQLYNADGALVASATTDANGNYYFNTAGGLQPNTQYYIVVAAAEFQSGGDLYGYSLTLPRNSAVNLRDSDAEGLAPVNLGDRVGIVYTTGPAGANDHSLDLGFRASVALGNKVWFDDDNDGLYDAPVRVGDYVWFDLDGDGVQDAGEAGVPGVRVTLYDNAASRALRSTTTDAGGRYLFDNLPAGNYYVVFDLTTIPLGFSVVTPDQGGDDTLDSDANQSTGQTPATGALALGQQNLTLDMGLAPTAGIVTVGDRAWYDVDRDGIQDANEPGVPGVRVELHPSSAADCDGTPLGATATDAQGYYLFPGLPPAAYRVCFDLATLPSGYQATTQNAGSDDALDSDADPTTGLTAATPALTAGQADRSLDMGIRAVNATTNSLGDKVWYDRDRDGVQDSGEGGVPGVRVALHPAGASCADMPLAVDVTDERGLYLFPGLPDGSYFVCFDLGTLPGGYEVTPADQGGDDSLDSDANPTTGQTPSVALSGGTSNLTLDMGIRLAGTSVVAVGDRVWLDADRDGLQDAGEWGVPGVGVGLYQNGQRCVANNGGWTHSGTQDEWEFGVPSFWLLGCYSGAGCWVTDLDNTYNNNSNQNLQSVVISIPGGAAAPVRIEWGQAYYIQNGGDSVTARYRCNGGTWTNMFTAAGGANPVIVPWYTAFQSSSCAPGQTLELQFNLTSDATGANRAGYFIDNVRVVDNGGAVIYSENFDANVPTQQASTGADGYYLFDKLPAGNYFVCFDLTTLPAGYQVTTQNAGSDDTVDSDADANGQTASTGALSGGQVDRTLDMGIRSSNASSAGLGDYVWYDRDRDGIQDAGEAGVEGVRVTLYLDAATDRAIASTTTDGAGRYLFTGLQPDTYYVVFDLATLPAGYSVTLRDQGGNDAVDSDADPATGQTASVTLAAGASNLTLDMGLVQAGTVRVGDRVWYDNDADGRQDPGETGVPGVTVFLHRATAAATCAGTPLGSAVTNLDGRYLFANLAPGSYFVCFDLDTLPGGYSLSPANNQLEDDVDSDADAAGKTPPTGNLAAGEYDMTLDMGIYSTGNVTVGDYVWYDRDADGIQDAGEGGVSGVTVELYRSTQTCNRDMPLAVTTTGGDGRYLFSKLAAGNYFVCFDLDTLPAGYQVTLQDQGGDDALDSDASATTGATAATGQLNNGQSNLTLDMGLRQTAGGTVSVGDTVWYDDDRDGIQDPGEAGVPGVDVELHPSTNADCNATPQATTTTNARGKYLFSGQAPGNYFVCFDLADLPTGYVVTAQNAGGDDGVDSDANPTTGRTANTGALAAGQADLSLDMGLYPNIPVESSIAGVTVYLFAGGTACAPDGSGAVATTVTDADGRYLFTGLAAGDYYVHIPAANFGPGGPLANLATSTGNDPAPDPDNDVDNDDNGTAVTSGACSGGVSSGVITLGVGGETTTDETDDPNTPNVSQNTTDDFGFYYWPTAVKLLSFTAQWDGAVVLLRWETADEFNNVGFNLYRAASEQEPLARLNVTLIPSQFPGGGQGALYEFSDGTAAPGTAYYWLEDVDFAGHATLHGPVSILVGGGQRYHIYLPLMPKRHSPPMVGPPTVTH